LGEVEKDPASENYRLTAKGRDELDRIASNEEMRDAPIRYTGHVDSLNELLGISALSHFDGFRKKETIPLEKMPLPFGVDATVYGSLEIAPMFEELEEFILDHPALLSSSVRKARRLVLKEEVIPAGRQLLWASVLDRLWMLTEWHMLYAGKPKEIQKPPPPSLGSILGFDLSLVMRYEGKRLIKEGPRKAYQAGRRLVGAIVLRLGVGMYETKGSVSTYHVLRFLERCGLIGEKDARVIHRAFKDFPQKSARKVIAEVACRYLQDGGVLRPPKDMTLEQLAEMLVG
jgi:hypothetical protein